MNDLLPCGFFFRPFAVTATHGSWSYVTARWLLRLRMCVFVEMCEVWFVLLNVCSCVCVFVEMCKCVLCASECVFLRVCVFVMWKCGLCVCEVVSLRVCL